MKHFLDRLQTRKIRLLKIAKDNKELNNISDLAKELSCSTQTLTTTVESLIEDLEELGIQTLSIKIENKLFVAKFSNEFSLDRLIHLYLKKSFEYQVILDCFFNTTKSTSQYAKDYYLSQASTYRKINSVKTILAQFNLELQQASKIQIIGEEKMIRYFFYSFFWETRTSVNWPFPYSKEFIKKLRQLLYPENYLENNTLINENKLDLWFAITLMRVKENELIGALPEIERMLQKNPSYLKNKKEITKLCLEINSELTIQQIDEEVYFYYVVMMYNIYYVEYDDKMLPLLEAINENNEVFKMASVQFIESLNHFLSKPLKKDQYNILLANLISIHMYAFLFEGLLSPFEEPLKTKRFDRIYPSFYKLVKNTYQNCIEFDSFSKYYYNKEFLFPSYMLTLFVSIDVKNYTIPISVYLYSSHSKILETILKKELSKMTQYHLFFTDEETKETDLIVSDTFNIPYKLSENRMLIWDPIPSDTDWKNLRDKLSEIKKEKEFLFLD
ncbi:helix-turn-helix domain-containing protein [Carnobacterium divergens]|uniref:Helix-turn-helix domain-containing protein n=1 Tax=Carnobacterium divergens TaxID=2748 RepID=A0AAW8R884_CARDV|nr:helix-turn-helix domain-containing protein [Carnobacterium divergens]MDT1958286.1 helix-turn-helix domain-containing protein [Carnobacterium divergens]MDT1973553.1 helix-turn-helix domain-containing protein [Carnobacterium divergens]MDT2011494.1 helix-turn-helix domain-containing protein [Carnobacterium divergens]